MDLHKKVEYNGNVDNTYGGLYREGVPGCHITKDVEDEDIISSETLVEIVTKSNRPNELTINLLRFARQLQAELEQ